MFSMVGDGSYLMLPGELVTAVAENVHIVVVLVDNHGYASIGALSRSVGSAGFGTHYRHREQTTNSSTLPTARARRSRPRRCQWTSPRTPRASARR